MPVTVLKYLAKIGLFSFVVLTFSVTVKGQLSDLARVEYTIIPSGASNIEYSRKRGLFNVPIKLKEDTYLFAGIDYSSIDLVFDKEISEFNQEEIEKFQIVDLNLGFTYKMNEDWRFAARLIPGFSSNLRNRELLFDDMVLSGAVVFIKDKKNDTSLSKPYRIIVGMAYSGNRGIPFPLPFISYYRRFHRKWSYNIGIPRANLQYHFSKNIRFKLYAQLDGFNANIQRPLLVNDGPEADRIRMALIVGGLRFEYNFSKHLELFVNTTYIFNNNVQLRRKHERIISLDDGNLLHYQGGLRFKL